MLIVDDMAVILERDKLNAVIITHPRLSFTDVCDYMVTLLLACDHLNTILGLPPSVPYYESDSNVVNVQTVML